MTIPRCSTSCYQLLTGNSSESSRDFHEVARIVRSRDFYSRKVEGKAFLIALTFLPCWKDIDQKTSLFSSIDTLSAVGKKGSYKLCRETARRIVDVIGSEYGLERRKTSTERVQDILEDVATTRDVEDMRATLLIMQRESQHLKDQFEEEVHNRNQEFIQGFFTRINSVRNGELLNTIAQTDNLIKNLQRQGWTMEPELQAIPMVIQIFVNFLRNEGIVPIERVNEVKELTGRQLNDYEFLSQTSIKPDELVKVIIRTPGWKFGEVVIARPRVEVEEAST